MKNRLRFNFGTLAPKAFGEASGGTDPWTMRTQCLVEVPRRALGSHRFLQPVDRRIARFDAPVDRLDPRAEPASTWVESLTIGYATHAAWQEATEREIEIADWSLAEPSASGLRSFAFEAGPRDRTAT